MTVRDHAQDIARMTRSGAVGAGSFLLGLLASAVPARWRRRVPLLESSAWPEAAAWSGLLQALLFLALFVLGYVAWINGQYEAIDKAAEAAGHGGTWDVQGKQVVGRALLLGNPLLPILFGLTTLHGFACAVGWLGGGVRMLHAAITKDAMPDPVLGLADWAVHLLRSARARQARERSKDRSPDRLILGGPGDRFAVAIETAADFDWREGNTVVVAGEWYRLLSRAEMATPQGLRLRYELETMPVGVALRGIRRYDPGHAPVIARSSDVT